MSDERQASEWAEQDFRERLASIKRCIPHMHDTGVLWPRDVEWLIAELERSRLDTKRLDWLDADAERLEQAFGATVRHEQNGDVRAIVDAAQLEETSADE